MHLRRHIRTLALSALLVATAAGNAFADDEEEEARQRKYHDEIKPVLAKHCFECHNEADKKAGLNLEDVFFVSSIIRNGATWAKVTELVTSGDMPPNTKPRLTPDEKAIVVNGINGFLEEALAVPDPGNVTMRRLSNREYRYSVYDLLGVEFETKNFFPSDGSGGEGFDNHARVLYVTTLSFERYYEAAERIVDALYSDSDRWRAVVPRTYRPGFVERIAVWWNRLWGRDISMHGAVRAAEDVLFPLATRAYRRFLEPGDKEQLVEMFTKVYENLDGEPERFDRSIKESLKVILVSPHFLYRHEVDLPLTSPYQINNFELASRLSYFLWSSMPDEELLDLAYRGDLHDERVLRDQVERLLADPKSTRFSESFATQWLGVTAILDEHEVDQERFPEMTPELRRAMYDELVAFFHHVLTERRTFRDLLDSDYAFLNATLAEHYGLQQVDGAELTRVNLTDNRRGGVLGMGGVLMATSLPTRTSPVLRGKWVLEQLLGTPPPPPPADVPELEEAKNATHELDLRSLLSLHREPSACFGCHAKMDPIGFAMENFDAVGRWRDTYGDQPIDASGVLTDGTELEGPLDLKRALLERETLFAGNLARKMLSFALGRDIRFQDKNTVDLLTDQLLENDFHTVDFITELVTSFPFRYKKSDPPQS